MSAGGAYRERHENTLLELFRIPVFRRVWAAIAFSSLGDWLGLLANAALAQQLTRSDSFAAQGAAVSGVFLVRLAPDLLFGPFAAALADKFDRRKTVIIGDTAAGLLYASIAVSYHLVWLYVAQFVIEAVGLFTQPAKQVIWVSIVPKKLLATANQISLFSVYGTVPVAAGLFALLSAVVRLAAGNNVTLPGHTNPAIVAALLLNTVTFLVSAGTIFLSRRDIAVVPAERERGESIFALLREGVGFVAAQPLIRGLYVGIIGAFAAGGLTVGVAKLWVATLSAGDAGYSIMFGVLFSGLALGMLVGPRVLPSYPRNRVFGLAIGGAGITLIVASLIRDFILATGLTALIGMFAGVSWIIGYTLIGQEVEDRLRGRIFAFVLSSVRLMLLLTIAVGPLLAGFIGSHSFKVGDESRLRFSGPGLTLLIGGAVALGVSYYAASRATRSRTRLRDLAGRVLLRFGTRRARSDHHGLFVTVDGVDPAATARYAALLAEAVRARHREVLVTAEPTDSPIGRRVDELLHAAAGTDGSADLEPEAAALLSAADRAEHVAAVIRPALEGGLVVVCDRFVLTSIAVHGGGRGADTDRIRGVNAWGTSDLVADLTLVVDAPPAPGVTLTGALEHLDSAAVRDVLVERTQTDPDRYLLCPAPAGDTLPAPVADRLARLLAARASVLRATPDATSDGAASVAP